MKEHVPFAVPFPETAAERIRRQRTGWYGFEWNEWETAVERALTQNSAWHRPYFVYRWNGAWHIRPTSEEERKERRRLWKESREQRVAQEQSVRLGDLC